MEQILTSLREERENSQKENEELRVQIRLCEDRADSLNVQLTETCRKLKESKSWELNPQNSYLYSPFFLLQPNPLWKPPGRN